MNRAEISEAKKTSQLLRLPTDLALHQRDLQGIDSHQRLGRNLVSKKFETAIGNRIVEDQTLELIGLMGTVETIMDETATIRCVCGQLFIIQVSEFSPRYTSTKSVVFQR